MKEFDYNEYNADFSEYERQESNQKYKVYLAYKMAKKAHKGQKRDEGTDYITHPVAVSKRLKNPDEIIIALLHDTLEDTNITYQDIKKDFGKAIADKVKLLTHEKNVPYADYLTDICDDCIALKIKMLDRIHNVSSLSDCPNTSKVQKYIAETETIFLPIVKDKLDELANIHYNELYNELEKEVMHVKQQAEEIGNIL